MTKAKNGNSAMGMRRLNNVLALRKAEKAIAGSRARIARVATLRKARGR